MTTFLVTVNIILLVILLFFASKLRRLDKPDGAISGLDEMQLIEFQQNFRQMLDELAKTTDVSVKSSEASVKKLEESVKRAEERIVELNYLLERNRLSREASYKAEVGEVLVPERTNQPRAEAKENSREPRKAKVKNIIEKVFADRNVPGNRGIVLAEDNGSGVTNPDRYDNVRHLLKGGMTPEEVSKITGLSIGEIELVKNIKKR